MDHPIFFDPKNRRAARLSQAAWAIAAMSTAAGIFFLSSLFIVRSFPSTPQAAPNQRYALLNDVAKVRHLLPSVRNLAQKAQATTRVSLPPAHPFAMSLARARGAKAAAPAREKPLTIAFYATWDETSYASLRNNLQALDWVVPSWLTLEGDGMELKEALDAKALDLIRREKPGAAIVPMIQNVADNKWNGRGLAKLMADRSKRRERLDRILDFVVRNNLQGIVIDFEAIPKSAHKDTLAFLGEVRAAFQRKGLIVAVAAPFSDPEWNYKAYAKACDYLMLMGYDEHYSEGEPGPIASQSWFATELAARMQDLDPAHTIVAIGNYGYDWTEGGEQGDDVSFQEAMITARDAKAPIAFDPGSLNPYYSYGEGDNKHRVWFLDAVTAYNQIRASDKYRPAGYALWRLGSEDPSLWSVLGRPYDAPAPAALKDIKPANDVDFIGQGEVLQVAAEPSPGARTFSLDSTGALIAGETYTGLPASFVIRRGGQLPGKLALTFDDGPSADWTPKILDVLKEKGVRATFFIIGENGAANPRLVQRIAAEGHDLGNHTFTHPNLGETPDSVAAIELNATQRLIEALTGRSTRLFRPPYFGDAEPATAQEIAPIEVAERLGYITFGLRVDPDDWQEPPPEAIVKRVVDQATDPDPERRGQVVLLHDGGGDRSRTLAALPTLIDALRAKGFGFVTASELARWTKDEAMPPVPPDEATPVVNRYVFLTLSVVQEGLRVLFLIAIALGVGRLVLLCGLALFGRLLAQKAPPRADQLSVSVLIPALNEAKVIVGTIGQVLKSSHPNVQVLVIDDGSTDGTADAVRTAFATDPRVDVITTPNGGKARAINLGLSRSDADIVVVLDADTHYETDTMANLVRWFADPAVGAVAGNAKVGNRVNILTRWQALEYVVSQNLERRALAALGCVTVVPGAVGAWRRRAVVELGGFPADTLAEDQDLTLMAQRAGYKVIFDADAVAWTEAPDTLKGLLKQRFRWAYGTLQCLWKHRRVNLNPFYGALGMVAFPQAWAFQIFFALVSPIVDLFLITQLGRSLIDYLQHGEQFNDNNLLVAATYYAVFMAVDLAAAAIAFAMERREEKSLLLWLMLQRFGYRQLMYYVVVKAVVKALQGRLVGWGKLERKATVNPGRA